MTSTNHQSSTPTSFARDLVDAARDNPVPTALIGVGLMWMFMGGNTASSFRKARDLSGMAATGLSASSRKVADGASSLAARVSEAASSGLDTASNHVSEFSSSAKGQLNEASSSGASPAVSGIVSSISEGFDSAAHAVGDAASRARGTMSKMADQTSDGAVDFITSLRNGFVDLLDRQPLVVGALGVAVGAGVAVALPRIAEEEPLTDTFGSLKKSVRDGFVGAYSRAADEARAQGLTLEAASDAVSNIGDKVSDIAKTAVSNAGSSS